MRETNTTPATQVVARHLAVDLVTSEVVRALEETGVKVILLKGPAVARWLYDAPWERDYMDSDLLVSPADRERAVEALEQLGFHDAFALATHTGWPTEHCFVRERATVDLHVTLPGVTVDPLRAWEALSASTESFELDGNVVRILRPEARLAHVVLHAAQHGRSERQPLADLKRAVERFDEQAWQGARLVAASIGASEAFAAGLHLEPGAATLARSLSLPPVANVETVLRAESAARGAMTVERLRNARFQQRLALVREELFPSRSFLMAWSEDPLESRRRYATARIRRVAWVLRTTPAALKAWKRARRQVRGS